MEGLVTLFQDPAVWAALLTLVVMEIVLGIDNLIFISIISNKLPEAQRQKARRIGISLALVMRLALLSVIAWLVGLTAIVVDFGLQGAPDAYGKPSFETAFSWRDIILIAGGLFLIWKATSEIHHNVDPNPNDDTERLGPRHDAMPLLQGRIWLLHASPPLPAVWTERLWALQSPYSQV